ncbi:MAG: hypothetical protein RUMPE_00155 [Eubacteriales bacterium SKADARSKE-1]|nr:hypothetical protein [Eubacteriales bacterium SKADARSKE-1]
MNQKYKLGLRALKTAISVLLCLLIAIIFHRSDMFFASIAAIICMQQTYDQTYSAGIHRLIGTIIGGAIGLASLLIIKYTPYNEYSDLIFAPLCILSVIYICNVIEYKNSVVIGCIVALSVILQHSELNAYTNTFMYVINRVIDTSIGIIIAMLVNKFLFRKKSAVKPK